MNDDELKRRQSLTFSQAEGAAALPRQLKLKEMSRQLRAALWKAVHANIGNDYGSLESPWDVILLDYFVDIHHGMASKFEDDYRRWETDLEELFQSGRYDGVLTFVEFVARHEKTPLALRVKLRDVLEECGAAYRVMGVPPTVVPVSDAITAEATAKALQALQSAPASRTHLLNAAQALTAGQYRDSIRESIHAVESVAKVIAADASATLKTALDAVAAKHPIHAALKKAFDQLYGYTSDEKGIRHALTDGTNDNVGEREAMFMFTSCAALCAYLNSFPKTK